MTDVKQAHEALTFLREAGLIFEINRRVLHPLGLAIGTAQEGDGPLSFIMVDSRDDPEGMAFTASTFADASARLAKYMDEHGIAALAARKRRLGFIEQER